MDQEQNTTPAEDLQSQAAQVVQDALEDAKASVDQIREDADGAIGGEPALVSLLDHPQTPQGIDLLRDVELDVAIELGRTQMLVEDVLKVDEGSVIELDKLAGDPVDVYVNGRLVARGEVLVLNDNFCIRVSEIVANLNEEAHDAAEQVQTETAEA